MRKLIFVFLSLCLCVNINAQSGQGDTDEKILNELTRIRKIQESNRAERDSIWQVRFNSTYHHKVDTTDVPKNEFSAMLRIADNTDFDTKAKISWWVAILAFIVSIPAFIISWVSLNIAKKSLYVAQDSLDVAKITYEAQLKTEENTKNAEKNTTRVSQEAQRMLLNELLRHLYRNFVITYAMRTKMKEIEYKGYPSEEHFEKLKIPMENIHLDVFYGEDDKFRKMHVLYLNLRNYNEEIDVALKHIIDPKMSIAIKEDDFDTLEFKVSYLSDRIIETIREIWGDTPENNEDMRNALQVSLEGKTNASGNIDVEGSGNFAHLSHEVLTETAYAQLYTSDELVEFCNTFNQDVQEERKKNKRGAWKIRIIEDEQQNS